MTLPSSPVSALPTIDLLSRLLGKRRAHAVYSGSLDRLFGDGRLVSEDVDKCLVARELVQRWLLETMHEGPVLDSPRCVVDYLQSHFKGREYESFVVLFLDAQHRLKHVEEMFRGTLTQTCVYPREVVKAALAHNSAALIFSHNHPSGNANPSRADELLTQALKTALDLIDVRVLDHLVIAGGKSTSFADSGRLQ